jgi:hypothetical protein
MYRDAINHLTAETLRKNLKAESAEKTSDAETADKPK